MALAALLIALAALTLAALALASIVHLTRPRPTRPVVTGQRDVGQNIGYAGPLPGKAPRPRRGAPR